MAHVHLLWDASDIWGLLAAWALDSLGLDWKAVRAAEVAGKNGRGARKSILLREQPALLFVPGGFSRHKSDALGEAGRQAVREYVRSGGWYMGICGGAGLGLSTPEGIGLCPWDRVPYQDRLQHFMSGHLTASFAAHPLAPDFSPCISPCISPGISPSLSPGLSPGNGTASSRPLAPLLPVWWPGLFDPDGRESGDLVVLARYGEPGPDFRLADLHVAAFPPGIFDEWKQRYGFSPSPAFLRNQPGVLHGNHGAGRYTLSYSHLETPDSPFANAWLVKLLRNVGGLVPAEESVPVWDLDALAPQWEDDGLLAVLGGIERIFSVGREAGLLFDRTPWLAGWRVGMPGAQLGSLRVLIRSILASPPGAEAAAFWETSRDAFMAAFARFTRGAESYLLAEQIAQTLNRAMPEMNLSAKLQAQRRELFGPSSMAPGGFLAPLLPVFDTLAFLQMKQ